MTAWSRSGRMIRGVAGGALVRRPRTPREVVSRALLLAAVVAAIVVPLMLGSGTDQTVEPTDPGYLADLAALEEARAELQHLEATPGADPAVLGALREEIAKLEQAVRLGYLPRDGDAPQEGAPAPDFRLLDLSGAPVRLIGAETPTVLNFWATWCVPCVEEMPDLERLRQAMDRRVRVLGVNRSEAPQRVRDFVEDAGVGYPILLDPQDALAGSAGPYHLIGMPTTYYIREDGVIAKVVVGQHSYAEMVALANALLGQPPPDETPADASRYAERVTEVLDSQIANFAVARRLMAEFESDTTVLDDDPWRSAMLAQTRAWLVNRDGLAALSPPAALQAAHDTIADAFLVLDSAAAVIQAGLETRDAGRIQNGINIFDDGAGAFEVAAADLRDVLAARSS